MEIYPLRESFSKTQSPFRARGRAAMRFGVLSPRRFRIGSRMSFYRVYKYKNGVSHGNFCTTLPRQVVRLHHAGQKKKKNLDWYLSDVISGAHGRTVTLEAAYPHFINFLAALLLERRRAPEDCADADLLLKLAEDLTWFDVPANVIFNHGPRYFERSYADEFFGAVFPDNRKIAIFMSTDFY